MAATKVTLSDEEMASTYATSSLAYEITVDGVAIGVVYRDTVIGPRGDRPGWATTATHVWYRTRAEAIAATREAK